MESFAQRRSSFALFNTSAASGILVESARGLKAFSPAFAAQREVYPRSCANLPPDLGMPGLVASSPGLFYEKDGRGSEPRELALGRGKIPRVGRVCVSSGSLPADCKCRVVGRISGSAPGKASSLLGGYWGIGNLRSCEHLRRHGWRETWVRSTLNPFRWKRHGHA